MRSIIQSLGTRSLQTITYFGQLGTLAGEVIEWIARGRLRLRIALQQTARIGFGSQLVVAIAGAFTGAVFAAQIFSKFQQIGLETATGPLVGVAMFRELGPVMTGLMVAGRVGAAMAAEIGTMRVSEQIDALRSMGVAPVEYLVVPRVLAVIVSMPILVAEGIFIGIMASEVLTVHVFDVPQPWFRSQLMFHTGLGDVVVSGIKGIVFGILIVLISCRHGLQARNGAVGVGLATTRAVVDSSVSILIINLFLTLLFNEWLPMTSIRLR